MIWEESEHYRTSYVLLWFIIESYVSSQFVDLSESVKRRAIVPLSDENLLLNYSPRRDRIRVSRKITILDRNKHLNIPKSDLDNFRKTRNEIVHNWKTIDNFECKELLKFIKDNSNEIFGMYLPFNEHIYTLGL